MCTTGVLTISKRVITFTFIEHQTDIDIETKLFSLTKREEKKKKKKYENEKSILLKSFLLFVGETRIKGSARESYR